MFGCLPLRGVTNREAWRKQEADTLIFVSFGQAIAICLGYLYGEHTRFHYYLSRECRELNFTVSVALPSPSSTIRGQPHHPYQRPFRPSRFHPPRSSRPEFPGVRPLPKVHPGRFRPFLDRVV